MTLQLPTKKQKRDGEIRMMSHGADVPRRGSYFASCVYLQ